MERGNTLIKKGTNMNKKQSFIMVLFSLTIIGLAFTGNMNLCLAQVGSNVSEVISQDTAWTQTNNPYNLAGTVTIDSGVTLTVEAGVTINLNGYNIQVNGTLAAKGTTADTDIIHINGDSGTVGIIFNPSSSSYDWQTGTGCLIRGVIGSNFIIDVNGACPEINQNKRIGIKVNGGSPVISFNQFTPGGYIDVEGGSPIISYNAFTGYMGVVGDTVYSGFGVFLGGSTNAVVSENSFGGAYNPGAITVSSGTPLIERNIIVCDRNISNLIGFGITVYSGSPLIENNTITQMAIGLNICYDSQNTSQSSSPVPTIKNNNIDNNYLYNIYLGSYPYVYGLLAPNITASNNWWGTTDAQAINQTIYDFKNDANLGTVTFIPFLTAANPQAAANLNQPVPTPLPTPTLSTTINPTASSSILERSLWIILPLIAATALTVFIILKRKKFK